VVLSAPLRFFSLHRSLLTLACLLAAGPLACGGDPLPAADAGSVSAGEDSSADRDLLAGDAAGERGPALADSAAATDARAGAAPTDGDAGPWPTGEDAGVEPPDAAPTPARLLASPPALSFPSTVVGASSAPLTVTITNVGGSQSGVFTVAVSSGDFTVSGCAGFLPPGVSCQVSVTFTPSQIGPRAGAIAIMATPGGTISVVLAGSGVHGDDVFLVPRAAVFPSTPVGGVSDAIAFTLSNPGGAPVAPTFNVSGEFTFILDCPLLLPPGGQCVASVRFRPTSGGPKTGVLTVSAGGAVAAATLTGTGVELARLEIVPASGELVGPVGAYGPPFVFTVVNVGDVRTPPLSLEIAGADATQFSLTSSTCMTLAGGATCTVTVVLRATSAGVKTATLTASAGPGISATAKLRGTPQ
jgi:hypothetical protein